MGLLHFLKNGHSHGHNHCHFFGFHHGWELAVFMDSGPDSIMASSLSNKLTFLTAVNWPFLSPEDQPQMVHYHIDWH